MIPAGALPSGPFGTLVAELPGHAPFRYPFTPEDALWTARFVRGEAGGGDDAENRAVIWAMLNRNALVTHPRSQFGRTSGLHLYSSFGDFLRAYSTTLQPYLRSAGAVDRAKRYARERPSKFRWVPLGGTFTDRHGTTIEKGQLEHHLRLQRLRWNATDLAGGRSLTDAALKGGVPNPIGLASQFADTAAYYRQRHRGCRADDGCPTQEQWQAFTHAHARANRWQWIGPQAGLRQYGTNAFFIDSRIAGVARGGPGHRASRPTGKRLRAAHGAQSHLLRLLGGGWWKRRP